MTPDTNAHVPQPGPQQPRHDGPRRVLFAVHDWSLGHATRSLLLIRALLERGDQVTVLMAPGDGLTLLRAELGTRCTFHPHADIPKPASRLPALFYVKMSLAMPLVWRRFRCERRLTERLVRQHGYELVISDSRFGVHARQVPSYCLFHSLRQIIPGRPRPLETLVEWGQRRLLRHYRRILIPDLPGADGLAGELAHDPTLDWGRQRLVHIGPLAAAPETRHCEDIDYFFSISGIDPHHRLFERRILAALPQLHGRIVVTRGRPTAAGEQQQIGQATVYGHLDRQAQADMLDRARVVVTRSGYTTLMELAARGKKALFVPTPGQSEQEYLARLHHARGHVYSTTQQRLQLPRDLARAAARPGLPRIDTTASVRRFIDLIS